MGMILRGTFFWSETGKAGSLRREQVKRQAKPTSRSLFTMLLASYLPSSPYSHTDDSANYLGVSNLSTIRARCASKGHSMAALLEESSHVPGQRILRLPRPNPSAPTPDNPIIVVCISDTHDKQPQLPDGDLLLHAGDLTDKGSYEASTRLAGQTNPPTLDCHCRQVQSDY